MTRAEPIGIVNKLKYPPPIQMNQLLWEIPIEHPTARVYLLDTPVRTSEAPSAGAGARDSSLSAVGSDGGEMRNLPLFVVIVQ